MLPRSIKVGYFRDVYKEEFISYLVRQFVTEDSWYTLNQEDKEYYCSDYSKHIETQKQLEDALKMAEIEKKREGKRKRKS